MVAWPSRIVLFLLGIACPFIGVHFQRLANNHFTFIKLTSPVFQDDYLAVEMINRKIRFVWSLGGEPGEVTHPMHIQTAGDLANDQHWYKIEVQR